jgi:hypothetical protein
MEKERGRKEGVGGIPWGYAGELDGAELRRRGRRFYTPKFKVLQPNTIDV